MSDDSTIGNLFSSLEGREIPGGCYQCDAVQHMTEVAAGIWSLEIAHDDDCPTLRAKKAKSN
jgi:hypothetical protein